MVIFFTLFWAATIATDDDWVAIGADYIEYDLEKYPLHLKTTETSSRDVWIAFFNKEDEKVGKIRLFFNPSRYKVYSACTEGTKKIPSTIPSKKSNEWVITKTTGPNVIVTIQFNGVEVADLPISDNCRKQEDWNKDVTKVSFTTLDTTSNFYIPAPAAKCNDLNVNHATVSQNGDSLATVTCSKHYALIGEREVTCKDGEWSAEPECRKYGIEHRLLIVKFRIVCMTNV